MIKIKPMHTYWLLLVLLSTMICLSQHEHFKAQVVSSEMGNNETQINYYLDSTMIGFISYTKVPLFKFYAIHSFYMYPKYRNKGYGKKLLLYTCVHLKKVGAQRMYIQPGPFEIISDISKNIVDETREVRIQKLIELYKKAGFDLVDPLTSWCAYVLYTILRISENSNYLMEQQYS